MARGNFNRIPVAVRLFAKTKSDPNTGCLLWTGCIKNTGYGEIRIERRVFKRVHRLAWEIAHGPIPEGMAVCHKCDIRHCINTDHLFLGTFAENVWDMVSKKRHKWVEGESHGMARLTKEQVRKIFVDSRSHASIAADFGVGATHVQKIKARETWRYATKDLP